MNKQLQRKVAARIRHTFCRVSHLQRFASFVQTLTHRKQSRLSSQMHHHHLQYRGLPRKKTIVVAVGLSAFLVMNLFLLNSIVAQIIYSTSLTSHGEIITVGVTAYMDGGCTEPVSDINWGKILPGLTETNTIYLRNEGNSGITLSLHTTNWIPTTAEYYMTLSWDYTGQTIAPQQVVEITLTLTINQGISDIETFGFDIQIIGIG